MNMHTTHLLKHWRPCSAVNIDSMGRKYECNSLSRKFCINSQKFYCDNHIKDHCVPISKYINVKTILKPQKKSFFYDLCPWYQCSIRRINEFTKSYNSKCL